MKTSTFMAHLTLQQLMVAKLGTASQLTIGKFFCHYVTLTTIPLRHWTCLRTPSTLTEALQLLSYARQSMPMCNPSLVFCKHQATECTADKRSQRCPTPEVIFFSSKYVSMLNLHDLQERYTSSLSRHWCRKML